MDDDEKLEPAPEDIPDTEPEPDASDSTDAPPTADITGDIAALRADISSMSDGISSLLKMLSDITIGSSIGAEDDSEGIEDEYPAYSLDDLTRVIGD